MILRTRLFLLLLYAIVLLAGGTMISTGQQMPSNVVDPLVVQALQSASVTKVIVALHDPISPEAPLLPRKQQGRKEIEEVLQTLAPDEFELTYVYESIVSFAGKITAQGLEKLQKHPKVLRIQPDLEGGGADDPVLTQPQLSQSVPLIQANQVHALGILGTNVRIAVLDTGIDTDHLDFSYAAPGDRIVAQNCFLSGAGGTCPPPPNVAEDGHGHGTNVSGVAASDGSVSSVGVAPGAKLVAVKVLKDDNTGVTSDWLAALTWIRDNNVTLQVKVINMSLGTFALYTPPCDSIWPSFASVINQLRSIGVIIFASSMNNANPTQMGMPACIGNTVSVGAVYDANIGSVSYSVCTDTTTAPDRVTCFTNGVPDLQAPGAAITASGVGGGTSTYYGTSQASPHAAGTAALMIQAKSTITPDELENILKNTGVPVTDPKNGQTRPRINALSAVQSLIGPANDNFANAQVISGNSGTVTGSNVGATKEPGEPNHAGNAGGASVWYRWTPSTSGSATIDTIGSNFDTLLAVYIGSAVNSLTLIASNDDIGGGNLQSRVAFAATAGTTYSIAVDGYGGATGNITLNWSLTSCTNTGAVFRIERATGNVCTDGSFFSGGADVAEYVDVNEAAEPGDVVELDPQNPKHYRKARTPYSPLVVGVISSNPGLVLGLKLSEQAAPQPDLGRLLAKRADPSPSIAQIGQGTLLLSGVSISGVAMQSQGERPLLALIGRVPVRATTENGPIRVGDLLTSASKPGYAMRCESTEKCEGTIIGKALEPLEEGEGLILVLLMR
jgi:subtilisin family serine protease